MRRILLRGGNKLKGDVLVSGAKNAALPILAATILTKGECIITNVPNLLDIQTMIRVLRSLGIRAEYSYPNTVHTWVNGGLKHVAPYELVTKMRASFFIIGPLLAKTGRARIPLPGGCAIGSRPVNIHLKGLEALGAKISMEHGFVIGKADKLIGSRIYLDFPSVGATETIIMAATLAQGDTIIENAAREPEIVDLVNFLKKCGAKIDGAGTEEIKISGTSSLVAANHEIIPDRVEAATLIIAAAITHGDVVIKGINPLHIESAISKLKDAGVVFDIKEDTIRVTVPDGIKPVDIKTLPYPGFPTDIQPQISALLTLSSGTSVVTETVFENRFMHAHELRRLGANIRLEGQSAIITGVPKLEGAPVKSRDLRAGAALVIAGLAAEGDTLIEDIDQFIIRGYDGLDNKLISLGAKIKELGNIAEYGYGEDIS
ncbi:UDP-N-acetylglucosamine 1-carboxyvinyltransferase [candidate division WOR-1 bacterium RIFOXYA2_FULL_36_21]|uniref:UDP-N-acetylglucosamine 1-carboxyvinyltransferase n=1 Tax=candidate division WOR-1 bacterium RIFOXYB2_FULL_36_35 TaxID=1802578 RepID=A0A1F4RZZ5_UNCSA|nr:MAG: UDP-N-acetylglucosamine 1-carboxyvinyltransferase [candidate division WOR-1 bacterium RIFOXYA2_FULL_36_21]OGC13758.1 MAG: UDP-N-acetylglucosamine 1-carboxyvinyltransferase [candidate division WOR-1 bacterium RIFOXYB2_FULL_36_35]OGC14481.1 MAG: UDP-N-acetylglucosamine 1-carboxyvinyltransferase [candidate division WOR-1 bacterium RIFOXYA12_FULL_36_13]